MALLWPNVDPIHRNVTCIRQEYVGLTVIYTTKPVNLVDSSFIYKD